LKTFYLRLILVILVSSLSAGNLFPQFVKGKAVNLPEEIRHIDTHILYLDGNNNLTSRGIKYNETKEYLLNSSIKQNYTLVNSLNEPNSVRGLKIILRATDQLLANPDALLSFRRAAARWERYLTSRVTVVIDVDFGPTRWGNAYAAGVLGSTSSAFKLVTAQDGSYLSVADIKTALINNHSTDTQLFNLYNAIPVPTPSTSGNNLGPVVGGMINFQGLGIIEAEADPDINVNPFGNVPAIGFNSAFEWDFDPSDGIEGGHYDFDGTVTHEIGHALGFNSIIGLLTDTKDYFTPWDLFRVRPEAVEPGDLTGFANAERVVTPGPVATEVDVVENGVTYYKPTQVFFDGLVELPVSTAKNSDRTGGDGQQAGHWKDDALRPPSLGESRFMGIMDPTANSGTRDIILPNDLRMLEVIGWNVDYSPEYASVMLISEGDTLDLDKSTDTVKVMDVPLNGSKSTEIQLVNLDLNNMLDYEIETIVDVVFPAGVVYTIGADAIEGSINSGIISTINFTASGISVPAVFFGVIRFHTNDENKLVVDIPFKVSVGGAIEPTLITDQEELGDFIFDIKSPEKIKSKELTIKNLGNQQLDYKILLSLSDKSNTPYSGLAKSSNYNGDNLLYKFYNKALVDDSQLLFNADFESGFNDFDTSGIYSEDWHRITTGPAMLEGHSPVTAAHFGIDYTDSIQYRSYSDAYLISKSFDVSSIAPQDLITLSFNYYLQAEVGYDYAYVLVSYDDGKTFEEIASSNGGILGNDSVWQSVSIQLPYLAGNSDPVKIAFRFTSDQLLNYEGWFIDDVQLSVLKDANPIYTSIKKGALATLNDENKVTLTVNAEQFEAGYYKGYLSILTNDPFRPEKTLPFYIKNLLLQPAGKNIIYASTGKGTNAKGKLLSIDKTTGAGTEIGSSGYEPLKSITVFPETGELYGLNTSAFTPSSIVRVNAADGYGLFQFESPVKLSAVLFDSDNSLYAASDDKKLFKLNPETGDTTLIGEIGFKVAAMTIDPTSGDIIASVDASSNKDKLYRINKANADTTYLGKTGLGKTTKALVFDEKGNLFGTIGEDTQSSTFLSIDINTGTATQIGDVGFRGVAGLVMVVDTTTDVNNKQSEVPNIFSLKQNYPNPFNPETSIEYTIPEAGSITLKIYDVLGKEVITLVNGNRTAGNHVEKWNASNFASGVYIYQLEYNSPNQAKTSLRNKMILTK